MSKIIVSTHSHPKVAALSLPFHKDLFGVSTHSHPKVAASYRESVDNLKNVSTHSHPKVAAVLAAACQFYDASFNTQPPEGGCSETAKRWGEIDPGFNTQPPEGGC